ncbi:MAG: DUF454 domain-containing protein [Candidatus Omnitrophota bacterium]|nr:MAG: DUF454 domain-containing protein [Candidatus Omnitrophota bacterium]
MFARWLWIGAGAISLILAIIGIILPLLPTTPLVILAAYCFSKSSPHLHQWLQTNHYFGSLLRDWEQYGIIRTKSKITATIAMVGLFCLSFYLTAIKTSVKILLSLLAFFILLYIWSRPANAVKSGHVD